MEASGGEDGAGRVGRDDEDDLTECEARITERLFRWRDQRDERNEDHLDPPGVSEAPSMRPQREERGGRSEEERIVDKAAGDLILRQVRTPEADSRMEATRQDTGQAMARLLSRQRHWRQQRQRDVHPEDDAPAPATLVYEDSQTLVAEARPQVQQFVAEQRASRHKNRRRRIDWQAYRGPAIPHKMLVGLRRKQREREHKAKQLARQTGMPVRRRTRHRR
ncbi:hypothetical protein CDCA_CDCA08G2466 [Cyanidium caldarium]|uniref:Uncharacterized protein n=1 Tax=Cyanidium caldarium TaxID=2771 RepID=A0AAV9IWJ6_CYACA|nr:hypothetical protein CDCA_CDCA08G2466 [Cyanidium caldarium]